MRRIRNRFYNEAWEDAVDAFSTDEFDNYDEVLEKIDNVASDVIDELRKRFASALYGKIVIPISYENERESWGDDLAEKYRDCSGQIFLSSAVVYIESIKESKSYSERSFTLRVCNINNNIDKKIFKFNDNVKLMVDFITSHLTLADLLMLDNNNSLFT